MTGDQLRPDATQLVATLARLFRRQGNDQIADLLEESTAHIETTGYDNWDGGTEYCSLFLQVPVDLYAEVEPDLDEVERVIAIKSGRASRVPGIVLNGAEITPTLEAARGASITRRASEGEHLWHPHFVRLFLSHVSAHKVAVSDLRDRLRSYGVSCFVAHVDIEPSREWQQEILRAIASMHAMGALLTNDFHASHWTDHEVGMAIARGVVFIPVRLEAAPYGFMSTHQWLRGSLNDPDRLASDIVKALATNPLPPPKSPMR